MSSSSTDQFYSAIDDARRTTIQAIDQVIASLTDDDTTSDGATSISGIYQLSAKIRETITENYDNLAHDRMTDNNGAYVVNTPQKEHVHRVFDELVEYGEHAVVAYVTASASANRRADVNANENLSFGTKRRPKKTPDTTTPPPSCDAAADLVVQENHTIALPIAATPGGTPAHARKSTSCRWMVFFGAPARLFSRCFCNTIYRKKHTLSRDSDV